VSKKISKKKIKINWNEIDTVLLDMDGTLVDHHYEGYFWNTLLPRAYAKKNGISVNKALEITDEEIMKHEGTFNWSSVDFWEKKFGIQLWDIRYQIKHLIKLHPHTIRFLKFLKKNNKKIYLVTASEPRDVDLKLSHSKIMPYFDGIYSQFDIKKAKHEKLFWKRLKKMVRYDNEKTILVDDREDVLKAAKASGIKFLVLKAKYNSKRPARKSNGFLRAHHLDEIIP